MEVIKKVVNKVDEMISILESKEFIKENVAKKLPPPPPTSSFN